MTWLCADSLALLANTLVKYQPVAIYTSPSDVSYMRSKLNDTVQVIEFTASRSLVNLVNFSGVSRGFATVDPTESQSLLFFRLMTSGCATPAASSRTAAARTTPTVWQRSSRQLPRSSTCQVRCACEPCLARCSVELRGLQLQWLGQQAEPRQRCQGHDVLGLHRSISSHI